MNLLAKTRKINSMLQSSGGKQVDFKEMSASLAEVIDANVYIVSDDGSLLGFHVGHKIDNPRMIKMLEDAQFPTEYNKNLLNIHETSPNLDVNHELSAFPVENKEMFKDGLTTVVPIAGSGRRLGSLIVARFNGDFKDDDLILAEYGATVVGMEILREYAEKREEEARSKAVVQMAISSLSYSEIEAVEQIFNVLEGNEGLLVTSKIADNAGISRSVIVNALRKLESAGVIDSRSLGMKGTFIRILNAQFIEELKIINNR